MAKQGGVSPEQLKRYDTDIRREFAGEIHKIADDMTKRLLYAVVMTLHDTYGFGEDRVRRVLEATRKLSEEMLEDRLTYDDVVNTVQSELHVTIT
jgi:hypothetical protein